MKRLIVTVHLSFHRGSVQRAETAVTTVIPILHVQWTRKTSAGSSTTAETSSRECTCGSTSSCDRRDPALSTNVSPNSADKEYYWRLAHHTSVFTRFILTHDSGRAVDRWAGRWRGSLGFPPCFYLDCLYFCHSMKPLATSFFFQIKIKNDIVVYIFWLPPDYEDRITLWPPGILVSRPEPWSSDL